MHDRPPAHRFARSHVGGGIEARRHTRKQVGRQVDKEGGREAGTHAYMDSKTDRQALII